MFVCVCVCVNVPSKLTVYSLRSQVGQAGGLLFKGPVEMNGPDSLAVVFTELVKLVKLELEKGQKMVVIIRGSLKWRVHWGNKTKNKSDDQQVREDTELGFKIFPKLPFWLSAYVLCNVCVH